MGLTIGMIGLDTSHAVAFTKLLNNETELDHVGGGTVTYAYPGGSPGFELSMSRLDGFTKQLETDYGVKMVDSLKEVAELSDAILLESVDGRQHLEQFREIVSYKKPVFIDKPFALTTADADEMIVLANTYGTPLMSSSALRFSAGVHSVLADKSKGKVIGADCFGPMETLTEPPGLFWYGIHAVEMLFTILGEGSEDVSVVKTEDYDLVTAKWKDGRFGTVRGNRKGNAEFGALIHFEKGTEYVAVKHDDKPFYASLLEEVMVFFKEGKTRVPLSETREVIRFIEAANESRETSETVHI